MEALDTLKRLARIMEIRKRAPNSRPYNLLLTSTLSLTPARRQNICGSDNWSDFRRHMHDLGQLDRLHALAPLLQTSPHPNGYRALARLITRGYFSTILTTNIDSALEHALEGILIEEGLRPRSFQMLVLDRDTDGYIVQALDDYTDNIRIVKLHGSLYERVIPSTFPDFFELRHDVQESVKRYLNQDIIIVGSIEHEDDMIRALTRYGKSSVYYALSYVPDSNDNVIKLIESRGNASEAYVIAEEYGDFDRFFITLEALLLSKTAPSSEQGHTSPTSKEQSGTQGHTIHDNNPTLLQKASKREAPKADVLIVTITEGETKAVFDIVKETCGIEYKRCFIGDKTYYDLGIINEASVFLVQSEMGVSGPGSSLLTVSEGIRALLPSAVVMVGIAFGFDPKKQHIGDILVSQQLRGYELQRYGSSSDGTPTIVLRGDLVPASVRLLDRFKSGCKDWPGQRVEFGLILSGEKLVDNIGFRDQLHMHEPEALGGEMEGVGLYAVAQRLKIDWILVKAICDWADGHKSQNKSRNQKKAARNAAMFTIHVLQKTRFI